MLSVLWEEKAKAELDLQSLSCLFGRKEVTELLSKSVICLAFGAQMLTHGTAGGQLGRPGYL